MNEVNEKRTVSADTKKAKTQKVLSILVIIALVLMVPVFIYNCVFLVKKAVAKDNKPPAMFGYVTQSVPNDKFEDLGMNKGDLIFIKKVDVDDVQVGDTIVFMKNTTSKDIYIQKVAKIETNSDGKVTAWLVESDTNISTLVLTDQLVGEYNGNRIAAVGSIVSFLGTPWGIAICMIIPLGLLVAYEVVSAKKKEKAADDDKAELMAELEALRKAKAENEASKEEAPEENGENKAE